MIKEGIDRISQLVSQANRKAFTIEDERLFQYDDAKQIYEEIEREYVRRHAVSNMESFVALVREELLRCAPEGGAGSKVAEPTGTGATLILTKTGGSFIPQDTGDGRIKHTYVRAIDPFWRAMAEMAGKPMRHVDFLRFLSSVAPAIENYDALVRQFRKVFFDERNAVTSQPLLDADGKGGNAFAVEFAAKGGTTQTALPGGFVFNVHYARGSESEYRVEAELDLQLRKDGEKSTLLFCYYCPGLVAAEITAQADEEEFCRAEMGGAKRLLILTDYR